LRLILNFTTFFSLLSSSVGMRSNSMIFGVR
jgi:hypothetical protein